MKKTLITLLAILSFSVLAQANTKSLQDSALNCYLKNDYYTAYTIYDSIQKMGYSSAELYFNLGNCCYNNGDIANAVYYFQKAYSLNPADADIAHNLKVANAAVKTKTEDLPEAFYKKWFNGVLSTLNSDNWLILSLIAFVLCLTGAGLYLFSSKILIRKTGFISGISLLVISAIFGIFSKIQANNIVNSKCAVVFEASMVKSSPSAEGTNLFEISEGMTVEITDTLNDWAEIKLADGKEGWVEASNIKRI
jgi:tetratricopeptide (TPR) repeat protein